jgi:hypothetical protein
MRHWISILLSLTLAGCATLKVRIDHRAEDMQVREDRDFASSEAARRIAAGDATALFNQAQDLPWADERRLTLLLASARAIIASGELSDEAQRLYNTAIRQIVATLGAADYSAAIAVLLSHGGNRSIDLEALFFTRQRVSGIGLFQLQTYDPNKIPVVFVHGLLSRPEAWTQAVNGLLADPAIRKNYQFWLYLYPTGLSVWRSAAALRDELDRFDARLAENKPNANLNRMILIGHSMGGLICSTMIREGRDKLWSQFSDVPASDLRLSPEAKRELLKLIYFSPRSDVSPVIFISTLIAAADSHSGHSPVSLQASSSSLSACSWSGKSALRSCATCAMTSEAFSSRRQTASASSAPNPPC